MTLKAYFKPLRLPTVMFKGNLNKSLGLSQCRNIMLQGKEIIHAVLFLKEIIFVVQFLVMHDVGKPDMILIILEIATKLHKLN